MSPCLAEMDHRACKELRTLVGGVLRTSTLPTLHLQLLLRGVIENKHSADVESPPPYTPRVCTSNHPEGTR